MPKRFEKKTFPYSPSHVFDLIADIESYPSFLPWCCEARILEREGTDLVADLVVGNRRFSGRFRSRVRLERPRAISVTYGGGALAHLSTLWTFAPTQGGACEVSFAVDFRLRSPVLNALMDSFFDTAFARIGKAFEDRAQELYGPSETLIRQEYRTGS